MSFLADRGSALAGEASRKVGAGLMVMKGRLDHPFHSTFLMDDSARRR